MTKIMEDLCKMFPDARKRTYVIYHATLTFGLTLDDLSDLLEMDSNQLYMMMINLDEFAKSALLRRWHTLPNLGENRQAKFQAFYRTLYQNYLLHNKEKFVKTLNLVTDFYYNLLMKNKVKNKEELDEGDLLIILKNQIKYTRSSLEIAKIYNMRVDSYRHKIAKLLRSHPEYIAEYQAVHDFYATRDSVETPRR